MKRRKACVEGELAPSGETRNLSVSACVLATSGTRNLLNLPSEICGAAPLGVLAVRNERTKSKGPTEVRQRRSSEGAGESQRQTEGEKKNLPRGAKAVAVEKSLCNLN